MGISGSKITRREFLKDGVFIAIGLSTLGPGCLIQKPEETLPIRVPKKINYDLIRKSNSDFIKANGVCLMFLFLI